MLVAASWQLDTALCGLKMFTGFESGSFSTVFRCSFSAARKFPPVEPDMKAAGWSMVVVTTLAKASMLPAAEAASQFVKMGHVDLSEWQGTAQLFGSKV